MRARQCYAVMKIVSSTMEYPLAVLLAILPLMITVSKLVLCDNVLPIWHGMDKSLSLKKVQIIHHKFSIYWKWLEIIWPAVSMSAPFGPTNTALVAVGLIFFFLGLVGLVLVTVLLIKNHSIYRFSLVLKIYRSFIFAEKCRCWHWATFGISVVYTVVAASLFLGLLGYSVYNGECTIVRKHAQ